MRTLGHLLVCAALVAVPSLWLTPPPFWQLAPSQLAMLAVFAIAYLFASRALRRGASAADAPAPLSRALSLGLALFGLCVTAAAIVTWLLPHAFPAPYPPAALVLSVLLGLAGLLLIGRPASVGLLAVLSVAAVLAVGVAAHVAFLKRWLPRPSPPAVVVSHANSSLYELELTSYERWLPDRGRKGGGLAVWDDGFLIGNGNGQLFLVKEKPARAGLAVTRLPRQVPINPEEFIKGAAEVFASSRRKSVDNSRFRVADVALQALGAKVRILASHHYWNTDGHCFVMRVSALEGTREQILDAKVPLQWRTVYDATPCLELNTRHPRGPRFEGMENGGRMLVVADDEILMSVGDHGFDGVNRAENLSQDSSSAYGKILRVSLKAGTAQVVSLGNRNVQGLYRDPEGTIWAAEHGPQGGDEINVIEEGSNYGWPIATYGTDYGRRSWPLNPQQGRHEGFRKPLYAFVPSVGLSALTGAESSLFPLWRGDLLVGSLKAGAFWRVRIEEGRTTFAEPMAVSQRIRDMQIAPDGRLVLWTDSASVVFVAPTSSRIADELLLQCTVCHGINPWDPSTLGPNLFLVSGRPVAARDDFTYSLALKELGGRWTRKRLDEFIRDPQAFAPGTTMGYVGMPDAKQRAELLDYLEKMKPAE